MEHKALTSPSVVFLSLAFPLLAAGCASSGSSPAEAPYLIRLIKGVEWMEGRDGYRPDLPGFVLDGGIGAIELQSRRSGGPERLVLLIRTSPGQRPNLEGFTFSPPGHTFSTSPFSASATVEVRETGKTAAAGRVPLGAYFEFAIEGEFVRVAFLPSATELMAEPCRVSWVDWYRR